jgi:hypothetical protein
MNWARILAYVTGTVDQELLLRNEYLAAENRILRAKLKGRARFSDAERARLDEMVIDWAAGSSARSQLWPGRTPSWHGTASWSPANSMARRHVKPKADPGSTEFLSS